MPREDRRRIVARLRGLSNEPGPPGCEKLSGLELYRLRQGNYRILDDVADAERAVTIVKIGHRRDVYR